MTSDDAVRPFDRDRLAPTGGGISRYDLLLWAVPIGFVAAFVVGRLLALPTETTLTIGALVGSLALADGLFRNPPRPGGAAG